MTPLLPTRIVIGESMTDVLAHLSLCHGARTLLTIARMPRETVASCAERVSARLTNEVDAKAYVDRAVFVHATDAGEDGKSARALIAAMLVRAIGQSRGGTLVVAESRQSRSGDDAVAHFADDVARTVAPNVVVETPGGRRVVRSCGHRAHLAAAS